MRSRLASELREERRRREQALPPLTRLALARRLGEEALAAFARIHGLPRREAAAELARRHRIGRRPSRAADGG